MTAFSFAHTIPPDWLLEANAAGAFIAALVNLWVAFVGDRSQRRRFVVVGALAMVYVICDAAQIVAPNPSGWLTVARAFGPFVYPTVWIWPAIVGYRRWVFVKNGVEDAVISARNTLNEVPAP